MLIWILTLAFFLPVQTRATPTLTCEMDLAIGFKVQLGIWPAFGIITNPSLIAISKAMLWGQTHVGDSGVFSR